MIRTYSELRLLETFEERYRYLRLRGSVGDSTFGFDRYINQQFYRSRQWKQMRQAVIARDLACDLGVRGHDIYDRVYIHHMNPMRVDDFKTGTEDILNPEYLISTTHRTHNAIHYGDMHLLPRVPPERKPGDTKLW